MVDHGRLVTQVIYLEDPDQALPIALPKDQIPLVTLTPAEISSGHFNFHSCVQVHSDAIPSELVTSNNDAQENFDHFEAVRDPVSHDYHVPDRYFYLANNYSGTHGNLTGAPMKIPADFNKPVQLRVKSELPCTRGSTPVSIVISRIWSKALI